MTNNEIQDLINQEKFDEIDFDSLDKLFQWDDNYKALTLTDKFWTWMFSSNDFTKLSYLRTLIRAFTVKRPTMVELEMCTNRLIDNAISNYLNIIVKNMSILPKESLEYFINVYNTTDELNLSKISSFTQEQVDALSKKTEELVKNWYENFDDVSVDNKRFLSYNDITMFKSFITKEEMLRYTENSLRRKRFRLSLSKLVSIFSLDEIMNLYESDNIRPLINDSTYYYLDNEFQSFFNSPKLTYTQDNIDRVISIMNRDKAMLVTNFYQFSKEDFNKIKRAYKPSILECKDATLDDYNKIASTEQQSVSSYSVIGTGRYTEEEMIKYPHMFSIDAVNSSSGLYMSKQTLTILNKAQGTRKRSKESTRDFLTLMGDNKIYYEVFTYEYFNYLVQKTKPTNEMILQGLKIYYRKAHEVPGNFDESIAPLVKLFNSAS